MTTAPAALAGGRYAVERVLGLGGMGVVYLARDTALDRHVAVKLLAERVRGDRDLRERFVREARFAARLSHPNIVAVFDSGEEHGVPYIVMECVGGGTLEGRAPLPAPEVERIMRQALAGLAHAHAAGLVHRDVKPQNLLLRGDGTLKISDFGIARVAHDPASITEAGTLLGTLSYLAPEVALGEQATRRSDLYGLGAVCYELLTGRLPRRVTSIDALARPGPVEPLGPTPLERAVMRCLDADPALRPESAEAVLAELDGTGGSAPTVRLATRHRTRPRGLGWAVTAAVLLLAVAGAFAAALLDDDDPPPAVEPVPMGGTPAEDARSLAQWLREHAE